MTIIARKDEDFLAAQKQKCRLNRKIKAPNLDSDSISFCESSLRARRNKSLSQDSILFNICNKQGAVWLLLNNKNILLNLPYWWLGCWLLVVDDLLISLNNGSRKRYQIRNQTDSATGDRLLLFAHILVDIQ